MTDDRITNSLSNEKQTKMKKRVGLVGPIRLQALYGRRVDDETGSSVVLFNIYPVRK